MRSDAFKPMKRMIVLALLCAIGAAACRSSQRNAAPQLATPVAGVPQATLNPDEAAVVTDKRRGYFDRRSGRLGVDIGIVCIGLAQPKPDQPRGH